MTYRVFPAKTFERDGPTDRPADTQFPKMLKLTLTY